MLTSIPNRGGPNPGEEFRRAYRDEMILPRVAPARPLSLPLSRPLPEADGGRREEGEENRCAQAERKGDAPESQEGERRGEL